MNSDSKKGLLAVLARIETAKDLLKLRLDAVIVAAALVIGNAKRTYTPR